ncbi:uncharacterized protein MONOS_10300 [Monocercomonoides exilis]|uniref:uncharacterized protein n=1 Tax=Monocercomonoides exilis TaxID=2049356 RepID=UPI0035597FA4|nr:hypothetical protein MONOS_10300 [Monocercomonoides exilis]|eukprot:MONOS_10300.1-p1 / transcript=MONOS_10300.1 / gene=MONOS_10300 / organism=Monocercomonoides_exilis_PA203 / gene_product=unspecified product / transcript_product=unspecified product / location=Mono_scaffold00462:27601-29070(-) / protein_length=449 / sequence_SO=supercontig / SO=protein_coding / is_pseudo=false
MKLVKNIVGKLTEMFSEMEQCDEEEKKQKIEEMNEMVNELNTNEIGSVFNIEMFNKIHFMIEESKISVGNAALMLKHIGYLNALKGIWTYNFRESSLCGIFGMMIIAEEKKKEEKDEKLLVDLCECFLMLNNSYSSELDLFCVPCLLKVALKKEEDEETRKEVEMALLALSCLRKGNNVPKELYLNELKVIILFHQQHHNLTHLACQSAWLFLMNILFNDRNFEKVVVNDLHFGKEAASELEDLSKCEDWKKEKEEKGKEKKEELILLRWIETLNIYFGECWLRNEECAGLLSSIVMVFRAAKDNHREICKGCIGLLNTAAKRSGSKVKDFSESGAIDVFLKEIHISTLNDQKVKKILEFFGYISYRLKKEDRPFLPFLYDDEMEGKWYYEKDEMKRKELKRKVLEMMEEEGYEDVIISMHGIFDFLNDLYFFSGRLSAHISDYFVNV